VVATEDDEEDAPAVVSSPLEQVEEGDAPAPPETKPDVAPTPLKPALSVVHVPLKQSARSRNR
jgi:hypothetical protein